MQLTETLNDGLRRAYTLTMTAADLDAKVDAKLAEAAPEIEMKGFRKGKVPMALLKKQFGPRMVGDALQEALDAAMRAHFDATGDRPAGQPEVKMESGDFSKGEDVVVAMSYEKLPEVPETAFSEIALEKLETEVDDASVEEALERLASGLKTYDDRAEGAAAEEGDQVEIDFVGRLDGEAFEGGSAEAYPLVLGDNAFIPGFEAQLVGATAGTSRDVTVTFPADYGASHLAGREVVFEVKVNAVRAPQPAPIDDEMAKRYGAESLDALRGQVRERIGAEFAQAARAVLKRGLLDALDKAVEFELPPSLVEAEASQIAHQLWHDENPDVQGHDHPEITPTEEHVTLARRRVKLGLLLADVGQKAEVEVSDAEMSRAVMEQARQYPGQERAFFEFVQKNSQVQQQLRAPIFEDKVVDHILDRATITTRGVTRDELRAAVDALDKQDG